MRENCQLLIIFGHFCTLNELSLKAFSHLKFHQPLLLVCTNVLKIIALMIIYKHIILYGIFIVIFKKNVLYKMLINLKSLQ